MKKIVASLSFIWKMWFYTTVVIAIIVLFPFIYVTSRKEEWYAHFFFFSRVWAWIILILSGLWPRVKWHEKPDKSKVYIICPNHTSMVDIMMTFAIFPNCFLFIGKKELTAFPLFGYFYKKTNLLVDRKSLRSRRDVFDRAAVKIDQGIGLCIYPEGGVPKEDILLAPFKNGAFKLAVDKQIPVIPVSYPDNKRHLPFSLFQGYPGVCRAVVHPFIKPESRSPEEVGRIREECYRLIRGALRESASWQWSKTSSV